MGDADASAARPDSIRRILLVDGLAVALAYGIACTVAAEIALPRFFTSVIWLPAGLAFGIVYVRGYRTLPGLFIGAILGLLTRVVDWSGPTTAPGVTLGGTVTGVLLESCIVVGHAALGTWLVRRLVRDHTLSSARSAAGFLLLAGPVACLVGSVLGPPAMLARNVIDSNGVVSVAFGFLNGDGLGVLLLAPIAAAIAGPPDAWRGRLLPIVLTCAATTATLMVLHGVLVDAESRRTIQQFELGNDRTVRRAEASIDRLGDEMLEFAFERAHSRTGPPVLPEDRPWIRQLGAAAGPVGDPPEATTSTPTPYERSLELDAPVATIDPATMQATLYRATQFEGVRATTMAVVDLRDLLEAASDGKLLRDAGVAASIEGEPWIPIGGEHERFLVDGRIDLDAVVRPTRAATVDRATLDVADARLQLAFGPSVRYLRQQTIFLAMIPISIASMLLAIATGTLVLALTGRARQLESVVAARTEQLARSEHRYRSIVDAVAEVIFRTGLDGAVQFVSRSWFDVVAADPLDPEGMSIFAFIEPADHDVLRDAFDRVRNASSSDSEVVDVRCVHDPGRWLQARLRHDPVDDAIVGTLVDLTPERRLEEGRRQFVSLVSHEFRTPVTVISGSIDTIEQREADVLPPITRTLLPAMQSATRRLLRLVEDLLLAARMDAGTMSFERAEVDLTGVLATCEEVAAADAEQAGVAITFALPDEPVRLVGDGERLGQLVDNLVSNAVKFSPQGTTVEVSLTVDDVADDAVLRVRDHGIGIDPADAEHLFERFWRSAAGSRAASGTGLGLPICRQVAEAHCGSIRLVPVSDGSGSCFEVRLPLAAHATTSG